MLGQTAHIGDSVLAILFIAAGAFSICGAVLDWDSFINSHKARLPVALFGRNGARVFYGLLGSLLVVLGLVTGSGILKVK